MLLPSLIFCAVQLDSDSLKKKRKADRNISNFPGMDLARCLVLADTLLESQLYLKTFPEFSLKLYSATPFVTQVVSFRDLESVKAWHS